MDKFFLNKQIQDLAWSLSSPCLLDKQYKSDQLEIVTDSWCQNLLKNYLPELERLDQTPYIFQNYLETSNAPKRLGRYFETLIGYWLSNQDFIKNLRMNVPVREGGKTLGEFDFLFFDGLRNQMIHWEVAVKFYLYYPFDHLNNPTPTQSGTADMMSFYGPKGLDML